MALSEDLIKKTLDSVADKVTGHPLLATARILKIAFGQDNVGGEVGVVLEFSNSDQITKDIMMRLREDAERAILALEGVSSASVVASRAAHAPKPEPALNKPSGEAPSLNPSPKAPPKPEKLPTINHVIAVSSGKGGVGKSTTSLNLAVALKAAGYSVGLLDLDIYGPSLPTLLGEATKPQAKGGLLQPIKAHGLETMSIGYLIDPDHPVVWRGPRVMGATRQLLKEVEWGNLDILVIDMPPGTGDVPLTMVQQVLLSGAIIVSTPQDLALIDARKGLAMFKQVGTPILGLIENMSGFECPNCGHNSAIFGSGGAKNAATTFNEDFLGHIPLTMPIREAADNGTPLEDAAPDSKEAAIYREIAQKIAQTIFG